MHWDAPPTGLSNACESSEGGGYCVTKFTKGRPGKKAREFGELSNGFSLAGEAGGDLLSYTIGLG